MQGADPAAAGLSGPGPLQLEIGYQPPYDWSGMLRFLAVRRIAGVELVGDDDYCRVVRIGEGADRRIGWLRVARAGTRPALAVTLSPSLAGARVALSDLVAHLFDLACEPARIQSVLGEMAADAPGLRVPGAVDGFELAVRAILGQQVSVKAAHTLAGRIADRLGEPLDPASDGDCAPAGLSRAFPTPRRLADCDPQELLACGLIRARAAAIQSVARALVDGSLSLAPQAPVPETMAALRAIRGIGDWTAQYVAMRALGWRDAFPAADLVLMRELGVRTPAQAAALSHAWKPWRAYAVMHLWRRAAGAPSSPQRPIESA